MENMIIKTDADYARALERLEAIFNSEAISVHAKELELLTKLNEKYENERYTIDMPDPVDAIKYSMEQLGYKRKDLAAAIGLKGQGR